MKNINGYIQIKWHRDDVKDRAESLGHLITDRQAVDILKQVESNYDANYGISWETFDQYIERCMKK